MTGTLRQRKTPLTPCRLGDDNAAETEATQLPEGVGTLATFSDVARWDSD